MEDYPQKLNTRQVFLTYSLNLYRGVFEKLFFSVLLDYVTKISSVKGRKTKNKKIKKSVSKFFIKIGKFENIPLKNRFKNVFLLYLDPINIRN